MSIIGKVSATQNNPTSADEFTFWLRDDAVVAPFDLIAVKNAEGSITVGVIKEIFHTTDSINHIANYVSNDFGSVDIEATTPRLGTVYAVAEVLSNNKEIFMPLIDGRSVRFANDEEIRTALGIDSIDGRKGHVKVPAGYITMSNNTSVPVCYDSAFLVGSEGAHMNISGISGLATKTSYAMFLLQSISQKMKDQGVASIIFNVKGDDLLYLDKPNEKLTTSDRENWKRCELEALPFSNVKYLFPFLNDERKCYSNTWCDKQAIKDRFDKDNAWNYIYTYADDKDKVDLLLSNIDDPNLTLDSIMNEITSGSLSNLSDWKALLNQVSLNSNKGQQNNTIPVSSWRKFRRLIGNSINNSSSGIFQDAPSSNRDKRHVRLSDKIESIKGGDTIVIDIAELSEQEKCLVFGDVVRTVYQMKTEGVKDCPSRIVIFVDELNKYAPDNIKSSPIIGDLLEITERGRSLGVILFSAEQFRSGVHDRVKGNCGTNVYGRTNAVEIASSDYRYLPKTYAHMMTRLKSGNLIIQHPIFRSLMKIAFPMPSYHQPKPA